VHFEQAKQARAWEERLYLVQRDTPTVVFFSEKCLAKSTNGD